MQSIIEIQTSFDKKQMDACNMRCLTTNSFNFLTPKEITCFSECTKNFNRSRIYSDASIDSDVGGRTFPKSTSGRIYFQ